MPPGQKAKKINESEYFFSNLLIFSVVRLPGRPPALLGTVAPGIPSATHPEPLYRDLADKEEAGIVATGNSL